MHHEEMQVTRRDDMPSTGSVMAKRSVFEAVGLFDESLEWSGEDDLFARQVLKARFRVWFTPRSVVHHLIPAYRLTPEFFRWISLRVGVALAEVDCRMRGRAAVLARAAARLVLVALVHAPQLLAAKATGDKAAALDRRCAIWRAMTYTYETLFLFAPRLFPQERRLEQFKLRAERQSLGVGEARPRCSEDGPDDVEHSTEGVET